MLQCEENSLERKGNAHKSVKPARKEGGSAQKGVRSAQKEAKSAQKSGGSAQKEAKRAHKSTGPAPKESSPQFTIKRNLRSKKMPKNPLYPFSLTGIKPIEIPVFLIRTGIVNEFRKMFGECAYIT